LEPKSSDHCQPTCSISNISTPEHSSADATDNSDVYSELEFNGVLRSFLELTEELIGMSLSTVDYHFIAGAMKKISSASYVILNTYESSTKARNRATVGVPDTINRASQMMNLNIDQRTWDILPERTRCIKGGKLVRFERLSEITMGAVPDSVANLMQKTFKIGDVFVIELAYSGQPALGDIILFMPAGATISNRELVELFANQIGALLTRVRSSETLAEGDERARKQRAALANLVLDNRVSSGEEAGAFKLICRVLAETIGVERASIWLTNNSQTELQCLTLFEAEKQLVSSGEVLEADKLPRYFKAILEENRIYAADAQNDPRTSELAENYLKPLGISSMLDAGIITGGRLQGVICLEHIGEMRIWHSDEEAFASTVASLVAQVLINAERHSINSSLHQQLQFEKMVSNISSYFVSLPPEMLNEGIDYALRLTGEFFNADRCFVVLFNKDGHTYSTANEWCAAGIVSQKNRNQNFPISATPWWVDKILNNSYHYIPDVLEMPPEAARDQADFAYEGIQSLLTIQLKIKDEVIGAFGFETVSKASEWSEDHLILIQLIAELISGAISRHRAEETIRHLSYFDQLTGLFNRNYLEVELKRLNSARQMPLAVIMADINGLKLVNDTYGHERGDQLLKAAAAILKNSCREEDIIARWGGDEFIILLPGTGETEAAEICKRISLNCSKSILRNLPVSIAIGSAVHHDHKLDTIKLLKTAEDIMYKQKLTESRSMKSAVLNTLLKTLAEKSFENEAHTRRMQTVAQKIGRAIKLPDSELSRLNLLITLHDIGKINIPEEILVKKDPLTGLEWEMIKMHPEIGFRIARATEDFAHVADDILSHHERWDGSGYPRGLKKNDIPLLARITAIADAYEVMRYGRPYKKAMDINEIKAEFKNCSGIHFDPELIEIALRVI